MQGAASRRWHTPRASTPISVAPRSRVRPRKPPAHPPQQGHYLTLHCGAPRTHPPHPAQAGDTLDTIASSLGLTLLALQGANPDGSALQVGQYVKLPGW